MITRYPSYYKDFKCIASKCTRSCCSVGWEIIIDKNTADYYKSVSGEFFPEGVLSAGVLSEGLFPDGLLSAGVFSVCVFPEGMFPDGC